MNDVNPPKKVTPFLERDPPCPTEEIADTRELSARKKNGLESESIYKVGKNFRQLAVCQTARTQARSSACHLGRGTSHANVEMPCPMGQEPLSE